MMTIKTLKSAGQAQSYYKAEKGIASYYDHDSAFGGGKWMGKGAENLGMRGAVGVNQFTAALEGHLPKGIEITRKPDGTHRPGVDLTFQAPKSVSVMALAAGDQRLVAAHDKAVERAFAWVEANHAYARLGHGGHEHQVTGNLAAAGFRHVTARPVNGVTDPQLHTHLVVVNATSRSDGKWVSASLGMDQDWIKAAGAIYKMELAREVGALGYGIEQTRDGFEIKGVSRETIERFSGRSGQIEAELERQGKTRATASAAEKDAINLKTRHGKEKTDGADLRREWAARAQAVGIERVKEAAQTRGPTGPTPTDHKAVADAATAAIKSAVAHASERESAFTRSALIGAASEFGLGKVSARDLERALDKEVEAGRLLPATHNRYTTQQAISREQSFITRINQGKDSMAPITAAVPDTLTTATGKVLSPDQRSAAAHILESGDRFTAVQGRAGTGKTTSMEAVREAAEASGFKVVGLAPTHRASAELRDAGITDTRTVASAIRQFRDNKNAEPNTLYIVDEAGMIPARDAAELVAAIERTGSRAAFVGDTRQLQAVEAGSPFRQMQEQAQAAELNEIRRQANAQLKECVQAFAIGNADRGAELAQQFMHEVKSGEIASQAAEAYTSLTPEDRTGALVITGTNAMRSEINDHIREGLKEQGYLGKEEYSVSQLQKVDMTREQSKHSYNYTEGQTVQFQRDYERGVSEPVERGRQYEVTSVDRDHNMVTLQDRESGQQVEWNPKQAAKVTLSAQSEIGLNDGDRVVFKSTDHERGITNGDRGTVIYGGTGTELYVALDKGGVVALDPHHPDHIEYAYCTTVHSAQGATCDRVIVAAPSDSMTATAEQSYVSLSRAREDAVVFTDSKADLAEAWGMERTKENAMEVALEASPATDRTHDQGMERTR